MPSPEAVRAQVKLALAEDVGDGDRTASLIPAASISQVQVICREAAILCGTYWFNQVFRQLDPDVHINWLAQDGSAVVAGAVICELKGNTRALLTGERTGLNYLQTLSGTATQARRYADAVIGTGVRILDTRKTVPGLRLQQKYAVASGGCFNHRIGLYDAILIKENHIAASGSITDAVRAATDLWPELEVEVEVEDLAGLEEAVSAGVGRILLDNFSNDQLRQAVAQNAGRARLEASGGIDLETIRAKAECGVDDISVGALTKDVVAIDLSMLFV
ncbi:MAG: carboxylating nicotinate-nucleotide diphosphorylase [Gammaproteobacteria bacterium]|nr:carboxylating nicotinate-nucleotide diphosphorylase [Gammaproteobacteria bacterium]